MADIITLDKAKFRAAFPAFSNASTFPDAQLDVQWTVGCCYLTDRSYCCEPCVVNGADCRETMLWFMLAHLLQLGVIIYARGKPGGGQPGITKVAKVDKVMVEMVPPPTSDAWDWWLASTPYGQQLLAMLSMAGAGGLGFVGGLPEPTAFRKWGGVF